MYKRTYRFYFWVYVPHTSLILRKCDDLLDCIDETSCQTVIDDFDSYMCRILISQDEKYIWVFFTYINKVFYIPPFLMWTWLVYV